MHRITQAGVMYENERDSSSLKYIIKSGTIWFESSKYSIAGGFLKLPIGVSLYLFIFILISCISYVHTQTFTSKYTIIFIMIHSINVSFL